MAAVVSQVPSVNKKPSTTTTSVVNPVLYSSSDNAVRRPQINELDVPQGKNDKNLLFDDVRLEIVNVVSTFRTHCHLDLRTLARNGANVEFRRDPPSVMMKIRNPKITASIWSTGKVTCIGSKSEADALIGARRIARKIQQCGFKLRFVDFKVINCLAVVYMPFGVRIDKLKDAYPREFSYEPELHPAASWKLPEVNGQLQVFQTGNATITAPNEASASATLQAVYHKLYEFRKSKDTQIEASIRKAAASRRNKRSLPNDMAGPKKIKLAAIDGWEGEDDIELDIDEEEEEDE